MGKILTLGLIRGGCFSSDSSGPLITSHPTITSHIPHPIFLPTSPPPIPYPPSAKIFSTQHLLPSQYLRCENLMVTMETCFPFSCLSSFEGNISYRTIWGKRFFRTTFKFCTFVCVYPILIWNFRTIPLFRSEVSVFLKCCNIYQC